MKKILVIDDDPEIVDLMKSRLESRNYEVSTAFDGEQGLWKLRNDIPHLIILDIAMPRMDGYTFVLELKRKRELRDIPVVMLTAKDQMKPLFDMEGVHDYFVKPFVPEELLKRLNDLLGE